MTICRCHVCQYHIQAHQPFANRDAFAQVQTAEPFDTDGTHKARSIPINLVNQAAYHYDLCCAKHEDNAAHNSICDNDMPALLDNIQNYKMHECVDRNIANPLIGTKV